MSIKQIPLGEIVATHGIAGWLRLRTFNPTSNTLYSTREIDLGRGEIQLTLLVDKAKPHKGVVLLKLRGIDDIEQAQNLVGYQLSVREDILERPGSCEYYYQEAMGLEVFDTKGQFIGTVTEIWPKEGGDLLVVSGPVKEHLIPAVKEIVQEIDLVKKRIILDTPEGLLDL